MADPAFPTFDRQYANTAVIQPDNRILDTYFRNAQLDFEKQRYQHQLDQDEVNKRVELLSPDISMAWEVDKPELTKMIQGVSDYMYKYPDAANPTTNNPESIKHAAEAQRLSDEVMFYAKKSGMDKARYYENLKLVSDPSKADFYATPETQKTFDEFKNGGIDRPDFQLPAPQPKANIYTLASNWEKAINTGEKSSTVSRKDSLGQIVNDTLTTQQLDLTKLPALAQATYASDPTWKRIADAAWNDLSDDEKAQLGNDPSQTLVSMALPSINATQKEKEQFRTDWMSQFDKRTEQTNPEINFVAQDAYNLGNPDSSIWTPITKGTDEGYFPNAKDKGEGNYLATTRFKGTMITDPNADRGFAPIVKIYRDKDGNLLARTTASTNYKDFVKVTKNQLVKDYWNQNTSGVAGENEVGQSLDKLATLEGGGALPTSQSGTKSEYEEEKTVGGVKYGRKGTDWYIIK